MTDHAELVATIQNATLTDPNSETPARFVLFGAARRDGLAETLREALVPLRGMVEPQMDGSDDLIVTLPDARFDQPAAAFEAAHAMEAALAIELVEAEIYQDIVPTDAGDVFTEGLDGFPPGCWAPRDPRIDADRDWALKRLRVREAWGRAEAKGRPSRGEGIVIAQPDTGITAHPELAGVALAGQLNLVGDGPAGSATDPLNYVGNPGHGTGTASVMVSLASGVVTGSAPAARHLPIRAIRSVVRLSQVKVAEAIDRAVALGAHVITMSLGGIYSVALQRAVERAVKADVIVLAAAGNCVGIVVWPARFDVAIAVAGTNYDDRIWRGSSRGADVDVSAPAENVFRATVDAEKASQGQGTSFAVALVAGVAACWLAYHGRQTVQAAARERGETVQAMFRRILKATARPGPDWDAMKFGAGIVNADALLAAGFSTGVEVETPQLSAALPDQSARGLALEMIGPAALDPAINWQRHGAEISLLLLKRDETALEGTGGPAVSGTLSTEAPEALRAVLGLAPGLAAPGVRTDHDPSGAADTGVVARQRRLLAARQAVALRGGFEAAAPLESALPPDAPLAPPADVLQRIEATMRAMPEDEVGDPAQFRAALQTLYRYAEPGLAKLGRNDLQALSANESFAMEAVIKADGSRPSFLLADGKLPLSHPFLGTWTDLVGAHWPAMQKLARAVGRIQPVGGHASRYIGTGTLIDLGRGLVLTNYHVLDDARVKFGVPMTRNGDTMTIHSGLEIDFIGEATSLKTNRFRVVSAALPKGFGRIMGAVDATVLQIEPIDGNSLWPGFAPKLSADPAYAQGAVNTLVTIGFPGAPARMTGVTNTVDWGFVTAVLFGNKFGLKRLAPGNFYQPLGSHPQDVDHIAFGHDATTFGGASGSLVTAWTDDGAPSFGLHFAGQTEASNYALAFAAVQETLAAIGTPF